MPQKPRLPYDQLAKDLCERLKGGVLTPTELCRSLGINRPALPRVVRRAGDQVLLAGKANKTRYALKREISNVGKQIPFYEVNKSGKPILLGIFHVIYPNGFYLERTDQGEAFFFDDLPYFVDDLHPRGFLGRLIPQQHPDQNFPKDIIDWQANDVLRYVTQFGWNLVGNLLIGEGAFQLYLKKYNVNPDVVSLRDRKKSYLKKAKDVLKSGDPGSSAGGERPKFLAIRKPKNQYVLVKFSPKIENAPSIRRADLLICEHVALETINQWGRRAAKSELLFAEKRVFLEMKRFDRLTPQGRIGIISMQALDNEFVGDGQSWVQTAKKLFKKKIISKEMVEKIKWLQIFGHLIGNTDMHLSNLSFVTKNFQILDLAPAYDMLPMLYAPQNDEIISREFEPPVPEPRDEHLWKEAWSGAMDFWQRVYTHPKISVNFQFIAKCHKKKLEAQQKIYDLFETTEE